MEIKFLLHNCGKTRIKKNLQTDILANEAKEPFRAVDLALALTTFTINADLLYLENWIWEQTEYKLLLSVLEII